MCPGGLATCPSPRLLTLTAWGLAHNELFDLGRLSGSGGRGHEASPHTPQHVQPQWTGEPLLLVTIERPRRVPDPVLALVNNSFCHRTQTLAKP